MRCCVCETGKIISHQEIHENRLLDGSTIRVLGFCHHYCDTCGTIQATPEDTRINKQIALQIKQSII